MSKPSSRVRLPLAVAVTLALAQPAFAAEPLRAADAQTDPHHAPVELDTIEVYGTPLPDTAKDLVQPVEVLAGARLDAARASSLGETVNKLPGVQSSYFGPGVGRPIIRGFDGARVQVLSNGLGSGDVSTVSVDHAVSIEPFLANQIEVLKGPATLLYGSGAIGGAVNVIDGRVPQFAPVEPLQGRALLRGGTVNDERTGMLRLDGSAGQWVFHFDAMHRETGDYSIPGFAESAATRAAEAAEHPGETEDHAYGVLPNSALRTDAAALGMSWVGDRGFIGGAYSMFSTRYDVPGHAHEHEHGTASHDGEHAAEGVTIVMDQRRSEARVGLDQLGALQTLRLKLAHTDYTHTEYEGAAVGTVFNNSADEARLELVHQPLASWNGALGLQWSQRDFRAVGDEAFVPPSQSSQIGVFWVGNRAFGDFKLELGARHDLSRIDVDDAVLAATGAARTDRAFGTTSISAALRWNVSDAFHLSLGLDRAQRAPSSEALYSSGLHVATGSIELGDSALDLETANRVELGLRWHNGPLQIGAALYQVQFDDFIYQAQAGIEREGLPVRLWTQHDARFRGIEGELNWTFLDNASGQWSMRAFGDLVRAELTGSGSRQVALAVPHDDHVHQHVATLDNSGNLPRIVPARVGAELHWRSEQWRASIGAVRYADQERVARHETPSAGYTLVDTSIAWHFDSDGGTAWELFLEGSNLLDEEARVHTSFLKDVAPLPGRSVAFGVRTFF